MNAFAPELISSLSEIDTATVSNGLLSLGKQDPTKGFMDWTVRCQFPELPPMVGYAVTATMDTVTPGRSFNMEAWLVFCRALDAARKPAVIVMQDVGPDLSRSLHAGFCMALFCQRMGAAGLVTNGGIRDLKDIASLRFPVFAPGCVASHGTDHMVDVNVPVVVGGMEVRPGDLIHGDMSGVVKIRVDIVAEVLEAACRISREEKEYCDFLLRPGFCLEIYEEYLSPQAK